MTNVRAVTVLRGVNLRRIAASTTCVCVWCNIISVYIYIACGARVSSGGKSRAEINDFDVYTHTQRVFDGADIIVYIFNAQWQPSGNTMRGPQKNEFFLYNCGPYMYESLCLVA